MRGFFFPTPYNPWFHTAFARTFPGKGGPGEEAMPADESKEANPEETPFSIFTSPQSEDEMATLRSNGEKKSGDTENKKITLMLARPLKYYQMGKYDPHIDAGNVHYE